jgi:eukaryotic-like serine/threonine-protein kinase
VHFRERPQSAAPVRFQIPPGIPLAASGNMGLSPDGGHLAFLGTGDDGLVRLYIRSMDSLDVRPVAGSETAANAPPFFWSSDSRFVAFDAGGMLKRVSITGGLPQTVCELPATAIGGGWNDRGDIILGNVVGGILRVAERGGKPEPITAVDPARNENSHLLPSFLSDGRHFVYERVSRVSDEQSGIYVGVLDSKPAAQSTRRILPYAKGLAYAPPAAGTVGHLLFVRDGTLVAQPFDERTLDVAGDAVPISPHVGTYLDTAFFAVSRNGVLAFRAGDPIYPIGWYDRHGNAVARVSEPGHYSSMALSPDGSRAVVSLTNPRDRANSDLWLLDLAGGSSPARFTFNRGIRADFPIWSPDGRRIVFRSGGAGTIQLVQKALNSGPEDVDAMPAQYTGLVTPTSWSPDGRVLLYANTDQATGWDLWMLRLEAGAVKDAKPVAFARSRFNEEDGRFSPDGRWVAYVSNESGANEIYVRAFSDGGTSGSGGGTVLVSRGGGTAPRWRKDGKELFYLASDGRVMAVDVRLTPEFRAATPVALFQAPPGAVFGDPSPDGQRFLLVENGTAPFTVMTNWTGR